MFGNYFFIWLKYVFHLKSQSELHNLEYEALTKLPENTTDLTTTSSTSTVVSTTQASTKTPKQKVDLSGSAVISDSKSFLNPDSLQAIITHVLFKVSKLVLCYEILPPKL